MNEPIKVGDLAVAIHACCSNGEHQIGMIGTVLAAEARYTECPGCGLVVGPPRFGFKRGATGVPASWLKRIPPLDELEGEQTREPQDATA